PKVPESLRAIVRDCMVTDREKRCASFDEIADRLLATMAELEKAALRLPAPARSSSGSLSDPDATNALPVVRAADLPLPALGSSGISPPPRSGNAPPSGFSTPWATPPSTHPVGGGALQKPRRFAYVLGAGSVALAVALIAAVTVRARGDAIHSVSANAP